MRLALRLLGFIVGIAIGWQTGVLLSIEQDPADTRSVLVLVALAAGGIGYVLGPHISWAVVGNVRQAARTASVLDLVAVAVGLAFGGIIAALLAIPLNALPDPLGAILPVVGALVACTLSIMVVLMRKRDLIAPWWRTAESRPNEVAVPGVLVDTSVIIDGRIADVIRAGFLEGPLVVPRFVLEELQTIADSGDPQRRARGRRGLETLNRLRQERPEGIEVLDADVPDAREVDAKLIRLARDRQWRLLTNDHNLGRVAGLQSVRVLNLNELATALRPPVLPGEELQLRLVQEGREAGQAVGYLDDGTMVVVDGGRRLVGQTANVTVTRLLPTTAGRLVFAVPTQQTAATAST